MPSPFPGMDPWLEREGIFPNLHDTLIHDMRDALNAQLPEEYRATFTNRVWIDDVQRRDPDVSVFGPDDSVARGGTALASLSGLVLHEAEVDPWEEAYLEIVSQDGERLVTAVEVLSLSNKRPWSKGREAYELKQDEYRRGGVNVVEIDLLRGGLHSTLADREVLRRRSPGYCYHVSVTVAKPVRQRFAAAWKLADRLPAFEIPLDPGVKPAMIDLQPMLDSAYDKGRYTKPAKYRLPPDPPLTPEQQAWADALLKAKGVPNA